MKRGMAVGAEMGGGHSSIRRTVVVKSETEPLSGQTLLMPDHPSSADAPVVPRSGPPPTTATGGSSNGLVYDRSHVTGESKDLLILESLWVRGLSSIKIVFQKGIYFAKAVQIFF